MKAFLGLLFVYSLFNLGLVAVGLVIGFLLHRIFPSVDLGTGILIGVVTTGFSIHYFIRVLQAAEILELPRSDDDLPLVRFYPLDPPRPARKRKRKET